MTNEKQRDGISPKDLQSKRVYKMTEERQPQMKYSTSRGKIYPLFFSVRRRKKIDSV